MNKRATSAYLAIIYGISLVCFETFVNWGQWQWWPYWLVDYIAAALLILGGLATRGRRLYGPKLLSAAWGFTLGMMWMSLAANISEGTDPDRAARVAGLYIILIVLSMSICLLGLILSLSGRPLRAPSARRQKAAATVNYFYTAVK